jgi:pimeloyl-ACP methyl ester carboxylesterase
MEAGVGDATAVVHDWEATGTRIDAGGLGVWMADRPATEGEQGVPILVLHGFPSSSFDWRHVLAALRQHRRVLLFDYPGFGLSDKPDHRYSIAQYADAAEAVVAAAGIEQVALLTHDLGNSVGGELLARDLEGALPFAVTERVLTNGSIYIDLAQLTAGQQMLLGADDARFDLAELGLDPAQAFKDGLAATFSPGHQPNADELDAQWALVSRLAGHTLLTRTIRYVEDRRADEHRFTGAIETHPSPVGLVWGALDPVAVLPMTDRFLAARPDARRVVLDDVGHYPMVETPERLATAILELLA